MYVLKAVSDCDHDFLCDLHNDPEVLRNVTDPTPITPDDHLRWWNSRGQNEEYMIFAVDGKNVGFTKFRPIDCVNRNVVLGADIHQTYRGNGYAKHMWNLMLKYCFQTLDMHRASLITAEYNHKAIHVYKKLGFKEEGRHVDFLYRDGKFHDAICMYMLKHEWPSYEL